MEQYNIEQQKEHIKSEAEKATELSHLIKEAMDNEEYNMAEDMIKNVLRNKEVPAGTKYGIVLQKNKLERILGKQIEIDESVDIEDIKMSKGAQISNKTRLIKEAMNDGRYNEANEMIQGILNDDEISEGTKNVVRLQLEKLQKIMGIEPEEKTEEVGEKKQGSKPEKYYEVFNKYGIFFTTEDLKELEESSIVRDYYTNKTPRFTRSKLYKGEIKFEDLKTIAEENRTTLAGCIFIAETCKYFCLEDLGMQALKGYKKEHPNITADEQKAMTEAIGLLKRKDKHPSIGEKWNTIYAKLDKARNLEEPDDEEKE